MLRETKTNIKTTRKKKLNLFILQNSLYRSLDKHLLELKDKKE